MGQADEKTNGARILTLPNLISVGRLGLLVWFLLTLYTTKERVLAAGILALAGSTDFLDGFVARRFHQVSTLGKVLDPAVDRVLLIGAVVALVDVGAIPSWLAAVALGREALVSAAVLTLAALHAKRIDVLFIGKAGTFGLMVALPLLLAGHGPGAGAHAVRVLAWLITVPSLVLSLLSAFAYLPHARRALVRGHSMSLGSSS